jgi:ABC-type uncharacterized transport system auxiliary subunit
MSRFPKMPVMAIAVVVLTIACATPPPVADDSYFRLEPSHLEQQFTNPVLPGVLLVDMPVAAGVRRSRKMIYSEDPEHLRFQQYHYHHWEDSPPKLIQRRLTRMLQASGVVTSAIDRRAGSVNYLLESRVVRFDRLMSGAGATAQIEIEFWLIDAQDQDHLLFHQRYEENVAATSMTMETSVIAFSRALESISKRLLADLGQLQR